MKYKALGRTGVKVSSICLGTMTFGDQSDESTAAQLFHLSREAGINIFDCANIYAGGQSEIILGKLIRECRDEVLITSKAYFPTGPDVNAGGTSRRHLMQTVEASLKRLGTDRIDIFYIHRFDDTTPLEQSLRALEDLVLQGKLVYLGASNFAAWQVEKGLGISARNGWSRFECLQPLYNLVKRQAEAELLPMALAEGLSVFPYNPLGGGLLTGKYGPDKRPPTGRLVDNPMYRSRYDAAWMYQTARDFSELAGKYGYPPAALAVAWVGSHPAVTAPIVGARRLEQLEQSLQASEIEMSEELRQAISNLSPEPPPATDRSEERTPVNFGIRS
jgi:aryl-alcohol dehydrogenase-like predicted oxidoreductase